MTGIELIVQERKRQIKQEGWTADHDKQHTAGELVSAAIVYAAPDNIRGSFLGIWPWFDEDPAGKQTIQWFKPTPDDRIRELTKAGALIAAEIDRLQGLKS